MKLASILIELVFKQPPPREKSALQSLHACLDYQNHRSQSVKKCQLTGRCDEPAARADLGAVGGHVVRVDGGQLLAADAPQHQRCLVGARHDEAARAREAQPDDVGVVPLGEAHHRLQVARVSQYYGPGSKEGKGPMAL